jgi:hypothetical protein
MLDSTIDGGRAFTLGYSSLIKAAFSIILETLPEAFSKPEKPFEAPLEIALENLRSLGGIYRLGSRI